MVTSLYKRTLLLKLMNISFLTSTRQSRIRQTASTTGNGTLFHLFGNMSHIISSKIGNGWWGPLKLIPPSSPLVTSLRFIFFFEDLYNTLIKGELT